MSVQTPVQTSISRSSFIKGAGATLALGTALTCASAAKAAEPSWNKEADIVVLGCGACGMVAALSAAEAGASVVAVEKNDTCGGDAYYSHGVVMGNHSRMDDELGIDVSDEEIFEETNSGWYLMDQPQLDLVQVTIREGGDTLNWLLDHGIEFDNPEGNFNPTYADLPIFHQMVNWGFGLSPLADQVEQACDLLTSTRATRLVQDDAGRVTGVVCEDADGNELALKANRGVILATGGYNHNDALVPLWDNRCEGMPAQGCPTNTGDGLIMAAAAGAAYMSARAEAPTSCLLDMDSVNYASFALPREGAICVGVDGKRFMLESSELKRINTEMAIEQYVNTKELGSDFVAFVCCNCDAIQTTIADGVTVFTDGTLEGLAEQMGVDPQGLAAEVAHYNEMVATGKDEDFGKEEGFIALEEGPYFGCRIAPHLNQSCGGLLVDEDSRVLRYRLYEKGESPTEPIEGLYAGGELVPYSMHYGYALSHAMSQGRLAVKHALSK